MQMRIRLISLPNREESLQFEILCLKNGVFRDFISNLYVLWKKSEVDTLGLCGFTEQ